MSEELLITRVLSRTDDVPGRSVNEARDVRFVIGEPAYAGGTGEDISPGEAFLAGISACGVMLVQRRARETGVAVRGVEASIEGARLASDTSWYTAIDLRFRVLGASGEQAEALVAHYRER
jgi:uncharacterized OsmC-like protein